ncbi:hypothetical protein K474DRAFT_1575679, partial [Panus rudis PR-1116 ss-1]
DVVFHNIRHQFYWPHMFQDVKHHVSTCHHCQLWSTQKVEIPPTVQNPTGLFAKVYADIMYMP